MDKLTSYISDIKPDHNTSYGEATILAYLELKHIPYLREVYFFDLDFLRFDFYLPKYKLAIEFDGRQHFEIVEEFGDDEEKLARRKRFDRIKNKFIWGSGGVLIRIRYDDDIIAVLQKKLKKYFPDNNELY